MFTQVPPVAPVTNTKYDSTLNPPLHCWVVTVMLQYHDTMTCIMPLHAFDNEHMSDKFNFLSCKRCQAILKKKQDKSPSLSAPDIGQIDFTMIL